jgi:hypothetical protein
MASWRALNIEETIKQETLGIYLALSDSKHDIMIEQDTHTHIYIYTYIYIYINFYYSS